jgi:hypothetical protein
VTIARAPAPKRVGLYVLSLTIVAFIGAIHLPFPFHGDQAMFATAAIEISEGGGLYTDFWDIKQPGIFLFFLAAGTSFGFTEAGIHLFELIYWLVFSVVVLATMGRVMKNAVFTALLPVLSVGTYYAISASQQLTQLEALAAFPIFVSMWLAYRAPESAKPFLMYVGSGLAGGVAMTFKLLFLVLLIPFWFRAATQGSAGSRKSSPTRLLEGAAGIVVGLLIPLGLVAALLSAWGALALGFETFFVIPPRVLSELPQAPLRRLERSTAFFLRGYGPSLLLAVAGTWMLRRSGPDRLARYLWSWFLFGAIAILLQRQSWWPYHFHLIGFPAVLLALLTLDRLWAKRVDPSPASTGRVLRFSGLVVLLAFSGLLAVGRLTQALVEHGLALDPAERFAFQNEYSGGDYGVISADVQFLKEPSQQGDIYVAGDPLYYWLSGRGQATSLNGWALEFFLDDQWEELAAQLESSEASYVFISEFYSGLIERKGERFLAVLDRKYALLRTSDIGTWYELVGPGLALVRPPALDRHLSKSSADHSEV